MKLSFVVTISKFFTNKGIVFFWFYNEKKINQSYAKYIILFNVQDNFIEFPYLEISKNM